MVQSPAQGRSFVTNEQHKCGSLSGSVFQSPAQGRSFVTTLTEHLRPKEGESVTFQSPAQGRSFVTIAQESNFRDP
jgi:hypothetical protein